MRNSTPTQSNSDMTRGQQTLLKDVKSFRLTPEQRAASEARLDATMNAMLKGIAKDNQEIFGTPIPEHLKQLLKRSAPRRAKTSR